MPIPSFGLGTALALCWLPMEPGQVTLLLNRVGAGDADAAQSLFAVVYDQLRRIAGAQARRSGPGHTLTPTALVNEAYLKMIGRIPGGLENRVHFFGIAARAMRQVLIDHAERKAAIKRGGDAQFVTFDESALEQASSAEQLLSLNEALESLGEHDPRLVRIVEYRFFAGLKQDEIAALLGISVPTVKREWRAAKAWLRDALDHGGEHSG
jgi:RNA polymerase sigma factor (TIGR02999 family)